MSRPTSQLSNSPGRLRRFVEHEEHKRQRHERLGEKVYGKIQEPIIPKDVIGIWDPPDYSVARKTSSYKSTRLNDGIDRLLDLLDLRCFYTGVKCDPPPSNPPLRWNQDPKKLPWLGTRDHLVPVRRDVPGCPIDISKYPSTLTWSSNVANTTLGLSPLLVRLKIRSWMMTIPFDREDRSIESGNNIRWLIIKLINTFRINGRFPWSRNTHGEWWYPDISVPFMTRMWEKELKFLTLSEENRDNWIKRFNWNF